MDKLSIIESYTHHRSSYWHGFIVGASAMLFAAWCSYHVNEHLNGPARAAVCQKNTLFTQLEKDGSVYVKTKKACFDMINGGSK